MLHISLTLVPGTVPNRQPEQQMTVGLCALDAELLEAYSKQMLRSRRSSSRKINAGSINNMLQSRGTYIASIRAYSQEARRCPPFTARVPIPPPPPPFFLPSWRRAIHEEARSLRTL